MTKDNEILFGLAERLGVEEGKAVHQHLMRNEVKKLADTIIALGETSHPKLDSESINENKEWNDLLDNLFEKVADFAREHGYEEVLEN